MTQTSATIKKSAKDRNREKIMHAAKRLFEEKGIGNVTMNEIAISVQMCRATVFNHFKSVNDLLISLGEQEIVDIMVYCESLSVVGYPHICEMFHKLIEDTVYYPNLVTRLTNKMILSEEEHNPIAKFEEMILGQLNYCTERALVRHLPPADCATVLMGAYFGLINHYHVHNLPFVKEELFEKFDSMLAVLLNQE